MIYWKQSYTYLTENERLIYVALVKTNEINVTIFYCISTSNIRTKITQEISKIALIKADVT